MKLNRITRRILLEENNKIPPSILRRIKLGNMSDDMKENSLRHMRDNRSLDIAISKGARFTAGDYIPWHDERGRDYDENEYNDWVRIFKNYLIENYGKETKEYLSKVIPESSFIDDGNKYIFWKHSERNSGSGFQHAFYNWGSLILDHGWRFPLDWWEIKSELDKMSEGSKLILRPGDEHNNTGYYFSIIKKKLNLQESTERVLREETEQDDSDKRMIKLIDNFMRTFYPNFNKEETEVFDTKYSSSIHYIDSVTKERYAKYWPHEKQLQLKTIIFKELWNTFGESLIGYVIDWFNIEFNTNAESVTF